MSEENEKKPVIIEEKDYEWKDDQERMLKKMG